MRTRQTMDGTNKKTEMILVDKFNVPVPTEIKLNKDRDRLSVVFEDGKAFEFTAEFLRVTSPSAEVQGHHPDQRRTIPGKRNVKITGIDEVGNYAIKLDFDDGHDTGIFSWHHLYVSGLEKDRLWQDYLDALAEKGMSRG